jgi:hypothetical protein
MPVLKSIPAVCKALGGFGEVARLTGMKTVSGVHQWKMRGWFPPRYFLLMTNALAARGFDGSPSLWRQVEAVQERKAKRRRKASVRTAHGTI